jgi:hypothetical protein
MIKIKRLACVLPLSSHFRHMEKTIGERAPELFEVSIFKQHCGRRRSVSLRQELKARKGQKEGQP